MDKNYLKTLLITSTLLISSNSHAAKLNVPEDFPNSFHMDLLSGFVIVDYADGSAAPGQLEIQPTGGLSQILFDATLFEASADGVGEGISSLTLTSHHAELASFSYFGTQGSFFLNGEGTGTLTDKGDGSGDWSMDLPLFAQWDINIFNFNDISLSTSGSHTYNLTDNLTGIVSTQTINGISMDYDSGDAFLVGQSTITEAGHPWEGLRITLGIEGNDPVLVSAVPVPAAVWLMGSGLIALFGINRRKINP